MDHAITAALQRQIQCDLCDQPFLSSAEKRAHMNGLCPVAVAKYPCPYCDKSFFKKVVLKNHIMTHTGERPYTCSVCGQKFRRSHHRKRHMEGLHNVSPSPSNPSKKTTKEVDAHGNLRMVFPVSDKESEAKISDSPSINGTKNNSGSMLKVKNHTNSSHTGVSDISRTPAKSNNPKISNTTNTKLFEKAVNNNNNTMPNAMKNATNISGGYITVPPQFSTSKQSTLLNIPLQNVTQMFTVSGQLGNIFPLMSAMIGSNDVQTSAMNMTSTPDQQMHQSISTSLSFPEITNAWSGMMEEDSSPYKCFLCSVKCASQCELETHFREHVKQEDVPNGDS